MVFQVSKGCRCLWGWTGALEWGRRWRRGAGPMAFFWGDNGGSWLSKLPPMTAPREHMVQLLFNKQNTNTPRVANTGNTRGGEESIMMTVQGWYDHGLNCL